MPKKVAAKRVRSRLLLIGAALLSGGSHAQGGSAKPAGKWVVDFADTSCSLIRGGEAGAPAFLIKGMPDSGSVSVSVVHKSLKANGLRQSKAAEIVLLPGGERFSGESWLEDTKQARMATVSPIDVSLLQAFAHSQGIALEVGKQRLFEMAFPSPAAGLREFKRCNDSLLSEWGIDLAARSALQQQAEPLHDLSAVFRDSDYPESALWDGIQGDVVVRYDITADGSVRNCVAVNAAADRLLANISCDRLTKKLRYKPAVGRDGNPVASQGVQVIVWRLAPGETIFLRTGG